MHKQVRAIIFDLDGTLLNTIDDIASTANMVLTDWGCPVHPTSNYAELIGDGLVNMARKVLPPQLRTESDVTRFKDQYRSLYAQRWNLSTAIYPGIEEMLTEIAARGIALAVLSNKRDDFTKLCVAHYLPHIPFREVRGERSGTPMKPDPTGALQIARALDVEPSECLFVGDSEIDVGTALNAGMQSIGVVWGFRPRAILEDAGCKTIISAPAQLLELL